MAVPDQAGCRGILKPCSLSFSDGRTIADLSLGFRDVAPEIRAYAAGLTSRLHTVRYQRGA